MMKMFLLLSVAMGLSYNAKADNCDGWDCDCTPFGCIFYDNSCGTNCSWELDDNGTLKIWATDSTKAAYMNDYGWDYSLSFNDNDVWVNAPWGRNRNSITAVEVSGISYIGAYAFDSYSGIKTVTLDENVKSLGEAAFAGSGLESIDLPSVTNVGQSAFDSCKALEYIRLADNAEIASDAFLDTPFNTCISQGNRTCGSCGDKYVKSGTGCVAECGEGYTAEGKLCIASTCPANCTSCNDDVCTACDSNHLLKGGNCSTPTSQGCGNGMYANGNVCTQCDSSCATCSAGGSCDTCAGNLLLQGGNCVETCSGGYYQDGSSCQQCDSNCATCSASGSCDTCSGNYAKQGSSCVETCDDGYYKDGNTCQTCDSSCATCSTSSSCDICAEGLIKQGNSCVSNCDSGYYKGGNNTCEACGENCASCYSSASCSTCKSNYLEKNGKCISASQGCGEGYKDMGGWCNRVQYTPAEAAGLLNEGNNNIVTITFKK